MPPLRKRVPWCDFDKRAEIGAASAIIIEIAFEIGAALQRSEHLPDMLVELRLGEAFVGLGLVGGGRGRRIVEAAREAEPGIFRESVREVEIRVRTSGRRPGRSIRSASDHATSDYPHVETRFP